MPKDTKSSGYNKAPACESRGFGHKKEGENFDTPSLSFPPSFVFLAVVVIVGGRTRDLIQPEYFHHLGKEAVYA